MKPTRTLIITFILLLHASVSFGQTITAGISKAVLQCAPSSTTLELAFDKSLFTLIEEARLAYAKAPDNAKDLAYANLTKLIANIEKLDEPGGVPNLSIIRVSTSAEIYGARGSSTQVMLRYSLRGRGQIRITDIEDPEKGNKLPDTLLFDVVGFEKSADPLGLVIQGVTKNPSMAVIAIDPSCKPDVQSLPVQTQKKDTLVPDRRFREKLDAEVTKEDANFLLDVSVDGTKRTDVVRKNATGTVGLTIVPKHFTKLGFHGIYEFQPFFLEVNYKATTDKTTFISNLGTRLNHLFVFGDDGRGYSNKKDKRQIVPGIATTITAKLEVDRFFKSTNLVGEIQSGIPINLWQSRNWRVRVEPSIGITAGRNLNQPDEAARAFTFGSGNTATRWIARPYFYGEFVFEGWRDRFMKPVLSINYRRSYPLFAEAFMDKKGKVVAGYSRIVRDYVTAKISFDAGKLLTPFISYERGRQSPGYVLVDNKFRLGISVKFKGKDR
ncbi:MAG: hypothetical protein JNL64_02045 [Blastocatellia bacterium]|nr:hypothetical protein [Blastocatellia bacterium]